MPQSDSFKDTFLILSLKNSKPGQSALWWRPNDSGYTSDINEAGGYPKELVEKNAYYYNNGETTKAISFYDILANKETKLTLEFNIAKNL